MRALAVLGWWLASVVRLGELLFGAAAATTIFVVGFGGGGLGLSLLGGTPFGGLFAFGFAFFVFHNHYFYGVEPRPITRKSHAKLHARGIRIAHRS